LETFKKIGRENPDLAKVRQDYWPFYMRTSVYLLLLTATYVGTQQYKRYFIVDRDMRSSEMERELVIAFPWQQWGRTLSNLQWNE
jgi:hypothetical protein